MPIRFRLTKALMSQKTSKFAVRPPWIEYPESYPNWGGWRQGTSETWLRETWFPFWDSLGPGERRAYLECWPPPDEDWTLYVTRNWA